MSMKSAVSLSLADGVRLVEIDGRTVLFSIRSGDTFGLNDSAATLLRTALELGQSDAIAHCASRFGVDAAVIAADLRELLATLGAEKLVRED